MIWNDVALVRFKRAARNTSLVRIRLQAEVYLPSTIDEGGTQFKLTGWIEHYGIEIDDGHHITYRYIGDTLYRLDDNIARIVKEDSCLKSSAVTILRLRNTRNNST